MLWTEKTLALGSDDAAYSIPLWCKGLAPRNYTQVRMGTGVLPLPSPHCH
jgi:hypothetical protein